MPITIFFIFFLKLSALTGMCLLIVARKKTISNGRTLCMALTFSSHINTTFKMQILRLQAVVAHRYNCTRKVEIPYKI